MREVGEMGHNSPSSPPSYALTPPTWCFLPQVLKLTASAPQLPTDQPCSEQVEMQDGANDIHDPPSCSQEWENDFTTAATHHRIYPTLPAHDSEEKEKEGEERKIKSEQKRVTFSASPFSKASRLVDSDSSSLSGNTGPFVTAVQTPDEMEHREGAPEPPPSSSSSPGPTTQPSGHPSPSSPTVPVNYAIQRLSESKTTVMGKKEKGAKGVAPESASWRLVSDSQDKGGASQLGKKRKELESSSSPMAAKRSRPPPNQDTASGILQPPLLPHPHLVTPPLLPSTPPQPSSESWFSQLFKRKPTPK